MDKMNLIVVVSDTLRRDHLPCYGSKTVLAPNLSDFAQRSLVFEDFYAASFPTVPARADLLTGKYTFTCMGWEPLPAGEVPLPARLNETGMLTTAIVDTPFLVRNGYGYDRGFQDFLWIRGQRSGPEHDDVLRTRRTEQDYFAPQTFQTAIHWLDRHHDERFFLYIDTWDPHEPWDPPAHYVTPYLPDYAGEVVSPNYWNWKEDRFSERDLAVARACYCGEISMVDHWMGLLLEKLETLGLAERTVVLFTSDHGFYFGEHDQFGKTRFRWPGNLGFEEGFIKGYKMGDQFSYRSPLHREVSHIPLIMHLPGEPARRVAGLSSIPDLMPTLLDLAGAEFPAGLHASSLMPLVRGEVQALHPIVVTSGSLEPLGVIQKIVDDQPRKVVELSPASITDGDWDLLYSVSGEAVELYDARQDPGHAHDLAAQHPQVVHALHAAYARFLREVGTPEERLLMRLEL